MIQNFCSVLLKKSCVNLQKSFHNSGVHLRNHYETLRLKRDCTSKEIRDSFIKLSKENHPDVNKDPKAHKKFLKIQEAYKVLSKPASRTNYDLGLSHPYYTDSSNTTNVRSTRPRPESYGERGRDPWDEPYFYHNRAGSRTSYEEEPYYGIRGIKKVSNGMVAFVVIMLGAASFLGQMIAINYSFTLQRDQMLKRSEETQRTLNEIRERAHRNGNERQVEIMRRQFEEADRQREIIRKRTLE